MIRKRLLVVDDALIMRKRIKSIAESVGWEVCGEGADGNQAITKYEELCPDLVTLDIVMPNKDGVTALSEILEVDESANVVMVTAVNQKEKLNQCIQLGALDFIVKPFDPEVLRSYLTKFDSQNSAKES